MIKQVTFKETSQRINVAFKENNAKLNVTFQNLQILDNFKLPEYFGEYKVIPKTYEAQTLETQNKYLRENITVTEIPFNKVSNNAGGNTVSIGDIPVDKNGETILLNI